MIMRTLVAFAKKCMLAVGITTPKPEQGKAVETEKRKGAGVDVVMPPFAIPKDPKRMRPASDAIDQLGETGQAAADWAATHSAELVVGIDQPTLEKMQAAVAQGISQRLGVPGTARLIRSTVEDMTVKRSQMIASTEMNSAFSEAALRKMERLGIEYKQIILAPDACEICTKNAADDPIPVDEAYASGDLRSPFHPNCRCAVVPSRPPGYVRPLLQ